MTPLFFHPPFRAPQRTSFSSAFFVFYHLHFVAPFAAVSSCVASAFICSSVCASSGGFRLLVAHEWLRRRLPLSFSLSGTTFWGPPLFKSFPSFFLLIFRDFSFSETETTYYFWGRGSSPCAFLLCASLLLVFFWSCFSGAGRVFFSMRWDHFERGFKCFFLSYLRSKCG